MVRSWQHPRWGIEFDWLASDCLGRVAVLSSSGYGAVPLVVVERVDQVDDAVDAIGQLPVVGAAADIVTRDLGGDYSDWHRTAARGFYAYDWNVHHGPYRRLASPTKPLSVDELPPTVMAVARLVKLSISFSTTDSITVDLFAGPSR